jgi:DNA invertase Pin-like site-specific DNA recombinase
MRKKKRQTGPADGTRLIGYARVSTAEQNLAMQLDALSKAGVLDDNLYSEHVSGAAQRRPQLEMAISDARTGDTFIVWKLDRMGRSLLDLLAKLKTLEDEGVKFRSLTEGIDTTTPAGRMMVHMIGGLAQFERDLVVERTRAGVKRHIEAGGKIGADRVLTEPKLKQIHKRLAKGESVASVAKAFGVSTQAIYHYFPGGLRAVKPEK